MKRSNARTRKLVAAVASADNTPSLSATAEKKLKRLVDPACVELLLPILVQQYPPWTASECAIRILYKLKASDKASRYLVGKLEDRRWRTRAAAACVLESFPGLQAVPSLVTASRDSNVEVRINAMHSLWVCSLGRSNLKQIIFDVCKRGIQDTSHGVRGAAFECLSHMEDAQSNKLMSRAAKDRHPQIRHMSAGWLRARKRMRAAS